MPVEIGHTKRSRRSPLTYRQVPPDPATSVPERNTLTRATGAAGLSPMRGLFYTEYGEPEDILHIGDVPELPMGPDCVRIKVAARA